MRGLATIVVIKSLPKRQTAEKNNYTVHKPRGTICFLNAPLAEFTHQSLKNCNKSIFGHDIFCSNETI